MKMKTTIFSLFFFSLIIIYCNGYATSQTLIENICRTASKQDPNMPYGFCTTSLQAAPASGCASLRGLGMISIRLARHNLTDTRCHIKQLLMEKRLDVHVRACLIDCLELYSDAIPSIKEGMKYYKEKRFSEANVQVSAVMDAATTCEDGFNEWPGVVSPLIKRNDATFKLSAIVLYIMHVLEKGSN